ncbi:MAG: phosphoribosyl-AMP cyclohydrolase [Candidatus Nanopelagicales bacterium]
MTDIDALLAGVSFDSRGLVPAIAQDADSGAVLMMAWMDRDALIATVTTGSATYFSRSRNRQWVKGEESGNRQTVRSLALDCDGDTILLSVDQTGPACHTGTATCFTGRDVVVG